LAKPLFGFGGLIQICQRKLQGFFVIYQIICSSESSTPMQWGDLEDILEHARIWSASVGITGALVCACGVFLQILEGDRAKVQALMVKIFKDFRHETVTVLRECEIPCAGRWHTSVRHPNRLHSGLASAPWLVPKRP
jgi:hypothetical protein